jgi:hypothetical protein
MNSTSIATNTPVVTGETSGPSHPSHAAAARLEAGGFSVVTTSGFAGVPGSAGVTPRSPCNCRMALPNFEK